MEVTISKQTHIQIKFYIEFIINIIKFKYGF